MPVAVITGPGIYHIPLKQPRVYNNVNKTRLRNTSTVRCSCPMLIIRDSGVRAAIVRVFVRRLFR